MGMKPHTMHTHSQAHVFVFEMGAGLRWPGPPKECFPGPQYQSSHLLGGRQAVVWAAEERPSYL